MIRRRWGACRVHPALLARVLRRLQGVGWFDAGGCRSYLVQKFFSRVGVYFGLNHCNFG